MSTSEWSVNSKGKLITGLSLAEVKAMVASGEINKSTLIRGTGRAGFFAAEHIPELWDTPPAEPISGAPAAPAPTPSVNPPTASRSRFAVIGVSVIIAVLIAGGIGFGIYARQTGPTETVAYWHRHTTSVQVYLSQFGLAFDVGKPHDVKDAFARIAKSKDIMAAAEKQLMSDTEGSSTFRVDDDVRRLALKEAKTLTSLVDRCYHLVMIQRDPTQAEADEFTKTCNDFFVERARVRSAVKSRLGVEIE